VRLAGNGGKRGWKKVRRSCWGLFCFSSSRRCPLSLRGYTSKFRRTQQAEHGCFSVVTLLQNPQTVWFSPAFNSLYPLITVDPCLAPYLCPGHQDGEGVAFPCGKFWRRFRLKNFSSYQLVSVLYSPHLPPSTVGDARRIACRWSEDVRLMLAVSHQWPLRLDHFRVFLCI